MVPNANTIIDPRAMMVKPFDTSIADCAVSASCCSDNLTVRTQLSRIKAIQQVLKINLAFQVTWISPVAKSLS